MANHIKLDCPDLGEEGKVYKWAHAENILRLQERLPKKTHSITESDKYHFVDGEIKHTRSTRKASKPAGNNPDPTES